ncbi:MAG TPA: LacI family DNA-binding transcriptional regulator [Jatrophihabitans sp.]|jgi:LacI family transcriptional regulator|nr:LacI family DNA-binding transcriptional regulator [Jatrophihabitans sp.]
MTQRSTIYEVARRSGVSTATVSRVMHSGTGYSAATRERVLATAAEIGWLPSGSARSLARRRAGIVGVLFPDLGASGDAEEESPLYVDQVIRGAERAATDAGDAVLIAATRGSSGRDLALSVATKVDGLVIVARSLSEADIAALGARLPVVVLSDHAGRRTSLDSVGVDNRNGIAALVEHLLDEHGYRDLVFVAGPRQSPDSSERFAGFRRTLLAAGLPAPTKPHAIGGFTEAGGARAVRELLADREPPDAIVCGNDEMAVGAVAALAELKLRVPADVAVTGFDDLAISRHLHPPLTTVAQPMRDIGAEGVRAVLARVADPTAPRHATVLATRLVLRRSCGCRSDGRTNR